MPKSISIILIAIILTSLFAGPAVAQSTNRPVRAILESFVEDFRSDTAASEKRVFGISISGQNAGDWSVWAAGKKSDDGKWIVELKDGKPKEPTFVYKLSWPTLAAIDKRRINALTAQGKAFSSDITPMAVSWMEGAEKFDERPFSFHFWTRGFPEKVPFRSGGTRIVHSSSIGVFFYQKGFRSAWARLAKGQGANNGPGNPLIAPFPTMVIITAGSVKGKVKGKPVSAQAGEMIFIPPMTPHEWWNEMEEEAEAILLFFGKGA